MWDWALSPFSCRTKDPRDPSKYVNVTIPDFLIARCYTHASVEYENFRCAKVVLDNPLNIYSGVRHLNYGYWCYTDRPETWYIRENVCAPFPENLVYAIYLNDRFDLYSFRSEPADKNDNRHIDGWKDRFGGLKWTANPTS